MKLIVDAQLPRRLAKKLCDLGWDAVHTLDLPDQNRTSDAEICRLADADDRIVVTKDSDFVAAHIVSGTPKRVLLISTGNIDNASLERILLANLEHATSGLTEGGLVEISRSGIVFH